MASAEPSVASLYTSHERELGLRWLAGRDGAERHFDCDPADREAPAFVGYMNLVRPHALQVLGSAECEHLVTQSETARTETLAKLFELDPAGIVVADGVDCPPALLEAAASARVPLLWAAAPAARIVTDLQHHLCERLARRHSMHGVLLEVLGVGVMLTGKSGVGKSELALELISRGHRLVADDAPDLRRIAADTVEGSCPPALRDFMEVRGLGIINIRALFGDSAIKQHRPLRLIIRLQPLANDTISPEQRLQGIRRTRDVLGVDIPEVTLPVAAGHNLAVLVECTVRNHLLLMKGYDAVHDFVQRQQDEMQLPANQAREGAQP